MLILYDLCRTGLYASAMWVSRSFICDRKCSSVTLSMLAAMPEGFEDIIDDDSVEEPVTEDPITFMFQ